MDRKLIEQYEQDAALPRLGIAGLTRDELRAKPGPGAWSIEELVLHLMDSDLIASDRMKRIIAEENPTLIGYDENAFVAKLHYRADPTPVAAQLFELNRRLFADVLKGLPDEVFSRHGTHNEAGLVTLGEMVDKYVEHARHHMDFLRKKRDRLGKPMRS